MISAQKEGGHVGVGVRTGLVQYVSSLSTHHHRHQLGRVSIPLECRAPFRTRKSDGSGVETKTVGRDYNK